MRGTSKVRIEIKPMGDEGAWLGLAGELDAYTGPQFREDLAQAIEEGARWLVVDLSALQHIDSVGIGILIGAAKRAGEKHGQLAVVCPRPNLARVFDISGTKELLNVVGSLEEARERLAGHPGQVEEGGEEG